jgi:hypothetical protein
MGRWSAETLVKALGVVVRHELPEQDAKVCGSPDMTNWSRHSARTVLTKRFACGLQFGLLAGIGTLSTPAERRRPLQALVNKGWRS